MTKREIKLKHRRNEYGEFCVKVIKDGKADQMESYFTDDWQDAVETAELMASQFGVTAQID